MNVSDVTGVVSIVVNGTVYEVDITGGVGVLSIPNLGNGTYNVSAYYPGDVKYFDCEISNITFTVSKYDSPLVVDVCDIMILDDEIINITVPSEAILLFLVKLQVMFQSLLMVTNRFTFHLLMVLLLMLFLI